MKSSTDGFMMCDKDLNVLNVNDATARGFGVKQEDIIGKRLIDISPGFEKSERYVRCREVLRTGKPYAVENVSFKGRQGDQYLNFKAFRVGDGLGFIHFSADHGEP